MNSFGVLFVFILGCVAGYLGGGSGDVGRTSLYVLYALMFQVGVSIGCSANLHRILRLFRPRMLLLPLATITGSLLFSALVSFLVTRWSCTECMAVGSGMGYYSLSSILITELKTASLGTQVATELGMIALLANILRELAAVVLAPLFRRLFGPFGAVGAAGVTSVDVALPALSKSCGRDIVPIALFHGFLVDLSVPLIVPFFAAM